MTFLQTFGHRKHGTNMVLRGVGVPHVHAPPCTVQCNHPVHTGKLEGTTDCVIFSHSVVPSLAVNGMLQGYLGLGATHPGHRLALGKPGNANSASCRERVCSSCRQQRPFPTACRTCLVCYPVDDVTNGFKRYTRATHIYGSLQACFRHLHKLVCCCRWRSCINAHK